MSHFTEVKVEFKTKNERQLIESLQKMYGKEYVQVSDNGGLSVRNYSGRVQDAYLDSQLGAASKNCHIVVQREGIAKYNSANNVYGTYESDIGFERQENGTYKVYSDNTGSFQRHKHIRDKLLQEYTCLVAEKQMKTQGYFTKRKVDAKTGGIQLICSKYA